MEIKSMCAVCASQSHHTEDCQEVFAGVGKKSQITCLGIDCPERTGGKCRNALSTEDSWEEEFKDFECFCHDCNDEERRFKLGVDTKEIKDFIRTQIKLIYEKGKEETQKEHSGWDKLKQCPQCYTMKVFTTKICTRCLERNESRTSTITEIREKAKSRKTVIFIDNEIDKIRGLQNNITLENFINYLDTLE